MSKLHEMLCPEQYQAKKEADVWATDWEKESIKPKPVPQKVKETLRAIPVSREALTMKGYSLFLEKNVGISVGPHKLTQFFKEQGVLMENRKPRREYLEDGSFTFYEKDTHSVAGIVYVAQITPHGQRVFFDSIKTAFAG